jgi:NitT/TauT family transport system substrate-binding protein
MNLLTQARVNLLAPAVCLGLAACGGSAAPAGVISPSAGASASAQAPAPAAGSARPGGPVVRLASGVSTTASLLVFLAADNGIFAKHGVNVDLQIMNGQAQMQAIVAGESDAVLHAGADLVFTTEAQGSDFKIVYTGVKVDDDYLVTTNDITSVEQIRGKKVGAQSATSGNGQILRRLLAKYGMQEGKDYTTILTGNTGATPGVLAALVAHQVDAAALPPAIVRGALKQGQIHSILDFATRTDLPVGSQVLVLQTKFVQQHPDLVQNMVDSLIESVRTIYQDKPAAEAELKSRFKVDPADLDEEWQRQTQVLAKVPTPDKRDFVDIIAAMPKDVKPLTDAQVDGMLDASFVNDAVKRGLTNY